MNRETVYLAALLHGIGEFWQRADESGTASSKTKQAEFLDSNRNFFESVVSKEHYEPFFKASVKHHLPDQDDVFQLIVQKADHYSSGVDRNGIAGQKDAEAEHAWDSFKNVRMVSIFGDLMKANSGNDFHVPIRSLSVDDESFPVRGNSDTKGQLSYAELWQQFTTAFQDLKEADSDVVSLAENLSFLLYRFASTVPSSTMHLPDVSLYDHLKSTGIFALCLYDYLSAQDRLNIPLKIDDSEAPVLLVGGDLSGIQSYIYDIVSTDAARNLKGRSFYLQIVVENAVEILLHELSLPWSAVVYASGGGFYLLAPNTKKTQEVLQSVRTKLSDMIFEAHQTNLSLQIDWQEVSQGQIFNQKINEVWRTLTQKIARLKTQKFKTRLQSDYAFFFNPSEIGGKSQRDHITGEEFTELETKDINNGHFNKSVRSLEGNPIKESTYLQKELGRVLRKTDVWISSRTRIEAWKNYEFKFGALAAYNYLFNASDFAQIGHRHPDDVFIRMFDLEKSGFDPNATFLRGKRCIYGFTFYGGNRYPVDEKEEPITFDKLAENGKGAQKFGVLRMDVDNLGAIFISGLGNNRRTFSRYSVLSRNLDFFFKGYLNYIWEQRFSKNASIIYSGGDDLFIVGHWSAVFDFAKDIQVGFKKWVCDNAQVGISGGIALTGGKFPISKGAEFSADAEKRAKEHAAGELKKNAITLFDVPLNWETELPIVEDLRNDLLEMIDKEKLPRGVLQKLLTYAEKARTQEKNVRDNNNRGSHAWRWHMAYDFSRAAKRADQEAQLFYERIRNAAFMDEWNGQQLKDFSNYKFLDLLEVAARWVELETKK